MTCHLRAPSASSTERPLHFSATPSRTRRRRRCRRCRRWRRWLRRTCRRCRPACPTSSSSQSRGSTGAFWTGQVSTILAAWFLALLEKVFCALVLVFPLTDGAANVFCLFFPNWVLISMFARRWHFWFFSYHLMPRLGFEPASVELDRPITIEILVPITFWWKLYQLI